MAESAGLVVASARIARIASPELPAQKRLIRQMVEKPLKKDDTWCLIDTRWFKQWKKYVGYDEHDNSQVRCSIYAQLGVISYIIPQITQK